MMIIYATDISEMAEIVYGLVGRGLTFEAYHRNARWEIHLLGGF